MLHSLRTFVSVRTRFLKLPKRQMFVLADLGVQPQSPPPPIPPAYLFHFHAVLVEDQSNSPIWAILDPPLICILT